MNTRDTVGFGLLLAGAIASWYLSESLQSTDVEVLRTQVMQNGFYLKSARILGTNSDGQLLYEIKSEYAEQLDNNEVEFRNVEIRYTAETQVPWILHADTALMAGNRDYIKLIGNVVAVSNEGFSGDVTEIRTHYLELEPTKFRAMTEEHVQIRIGMRSITATGMLAMLQTNQLQLKSDVSGNFVP